MASTSASDRGSVDIEHTAYVSCMVSLKWPCASIFTPDSAKPERTMVIVSTNGSSRGASLSSEKHLARILAIDCRVILCRELWNKARYTALATIGPSASCIGLDKSRQRTFDTCIYGTYHFVARILRNARNSSALARLRDSSGCCVSLEAV